jgi:hypothetical protein
MSLVLTMPVEQRGGAPVDPGLCESAAAAEAGAANGAAVASPWRRRDWRPAGGRAGVTFLAGLLRGEGQGLHPAAAVALGSATAAAVIAAVASVCENSQ